LLYRREFSQFLVVKSTHQTTSAGHTACHVAAMSGDDGEFFGTTAADAQINLELVLVAAATAAGIASTTASATATVSTPHTHFTSGRSGGGGSGATILAETRRVGHAAIKVSAKETCHVEAADGNPASPLPYAATPDRNGVTPIHHAAIAGR
jgi:ankyrin repeat protein